MYCGNCGSEIPDGSEFCERCGNHPVHEHKPGGGPARGPADDAGYGPSGGPEADEPQVDGYEIYDQFGEEERPLSEDETLQKEDIYGSFDLEDEDRPKERRDKKVSGGTAAVCIILSVLMCLFAAAAAASGIARYAVRDDVVKNSVVRSDLDDYPVESDGRKTNLSEYLCEAIENSGKELGFKKRDINKLLKERSVKEYFGEVFVGYKNDLTDGNEITPYNCGDIAGWMYENADTVKKVSGIDVDAEARDLLANSLRNSQLDLGGASFEELIGVDRGVATFLMSDVFFYVSTVLFAGLALLVFVCSDYNFRFFLSCVGVVLLAAGIILLVFFAFLMIAGRGSGVLAAILLTATLKPFIVVCAAAVLLGVVCEVVSYFARRNSRSVKKR